MKQDDIYLIDMLRLLRREWPWFALPLLVSLALAALFLRVAAPQWEATAWLQAGELGTTAAGHDPKIEPFQRTLDRLKTRQFQDDVLAQLPVPANGRTARLYRKSLALEPDPYANLIRINVRADSPALARRLAETTVTHLQAIHRGLAAQPLQQSRLRLRRVDAELRDALADRARLLPQAEGEAGRAAEGRLLAGMLLSEKDAAIRALQAERDDLQARLGARYTFDTSQPWPMYVPDRAVSPNPVVAWGLGVLLGVGLGVLAAVARNAWRRARG